MNTVVQDQTGRSCYIGDLPKRIISLVPSITELLADLGLEDRLVGITKFCIHPNHIYRSKTRIGGTKQVKLDVIRQLQPDLIIANQEENDQKQVETLMAEFPVWVSKVVDVPTACQMIMDIGMITGTQEKAHAIVHRIQSGLHQLPERSRRPSALYIIWHKPIMAAGGDTFIHSMLQVAGYDNLLQQKNRYPTLSDEDLPLIRPDYVFLSSEPFPFQEKHLDYYQAAFPESTILLVDGELFSWYGSRMIQSGDYFLRLRQKTDNM